MALRSQFKDGGCGGIDFQELFFLFLSSCLISFCAAHEGLNSIFSVVIITFALLILDFVIKLL